MNNLLKDTPVEKYKINKRLIYVKREDLCGVEGSPTFSKIRGLIQYLTTLKQQGVCVVGYTETSISMAGWGVAWACSKLGMKAVIFDPQYKRDENVPYLLEYHRIQWKLYNAEIIPIPAGMAKVNWYISKNILEEKYKRECVHLPLGLPFPETIELTAKEVEKTMLDLPFMHNVVVNIGSGTITAGIWKGLTKIQYPSTVWGIMGRNGNVVNKYSIIQHKAQVIGDGLLKSNIPLNIVNPGWEYTERSNIESPFPCHPYYDLKAWEWLTKNHNKLDGNILFWNIGH